MNNEMDVNRVLGVLARKWKSVALITLLVMGAGYGYIATSEPVYEAQAQVTYQEPTRDKNPTGGFLPSTGITRENTATLVGNAANGEVIAAAAKAVGMTSESLRGAVRVQSNGDASMINFVARDGSAKTAARMADAYAKAFVENRREGALRPIEQQIAAKRMQLKSYSRLAKDDPNQMIRTQLTADVSEWESQSKLWGNSIQVSDTAAVPASPVWPRTMMTLIAAAFVGLVLGSGVALLTASVDRKLRPEHLDRLPAPALVKVPVATHAPKDMPMGPANIEPLIADAFAALGARIMLDRTGSGAHVLLISSARSGEGKSTVAANLASALAQGGRRVVLLDADMRRPTQDMLFPALQGRFGLSQVLTNTVDLEHALTLVAPNLAAVGSGPRQENASMLLASVSFRTLIDRLSGISDVVVIDAPPVLAVNDALAMAPVANHVLLCARFGTSNLGEINDAHAKFASASATAQSMVLVGTERPTGYGYDQVLGSARQLQRMSAQPQREVSGVA